MQEDYSAVDGHERDNLAMEQGCILLPLQFDRATSPCILERPENMSIED